MVGFQSFYLIVNFVPLSLHITNCAAILIAPYFLREKSFNFFEVGGGGDDEQDRVKPRIVCSKLISLTTGLHVILDEECTFEVKVEKCTLGVTKDFLKAFSMYIASFYIFNIAYPKSMEHTLVFIQKCLLKLSDSTKTSSRVLSLIAKLKKTV